MEVGDLSEADKFERFTEVVNQKFPKAQRPLRRILYNKTVSGKDPWTLEKSFQFVYGEIREWETEGLPQGFQRFKRRKDL